MLHKRLLAGSALALAMGAVLVGDLSFAPYFPCLLACAVVAAVPATHELLLLLPKDSRPRLVVCGPAVALTLLANWWAPLLGGEAWRPVLLVVAFAAIAAFLVEMVAYRGPGANTARVANAVLVVAYLGLLPSFFLQLRWLFADVELGSLALAATIFVPKCGDIGAYFTGKAIGRHAFSPTLSPKKTWEGFAGGMLLAVGTAVGFSHLGPLFRHGMMEAVGFGLAVGLAGVLGDLAESMVKRDAGTKDAARSIPGFGGVLDVIDSVVFAGPVAYVWFSIGN